MEWLWPQTILVSLLYHVGYERWVRYPDSLECLTHIYICDFVSD
jgi:hypothetical protein